jgi:hypothetical protein
MSSNVPSVPFQNDNTPRSDEKDMKNAYDEEHVESASAGDRKGTIISADFDQYLNDAQEAVTGQKQQSILEALKQYRRGVMYSMIFSTYVVILSKANETDRQCYYHGRI